jgi:hypothetical protein
MKKIFNRTVITWVIRLIVAFIASQITGMGIAYCLAGYFAAIFLFDIALRLLLSLIGVVFMLILVLTLFAGLLTI